MFEGGKRNSPKIDAAIQIKELYKVAFLVFGKEFPEGKKMFSNKYFCISSEFLPVLRDGRRGEGGSMASLFVFGSRWFFNNSGRNVVSNVNITYNAVYT